jgi:hypothetical protein
MVGRIVPSPGTPCRRFGSLTHYHFNAPTPRARNIQVVHPVLPGIDRGSMGRSPREACPRRSPESNDRAEPDPADRRSGSRGLTLGQSVGVGSAGSFRLDTRRLGMVGKTRRIRLDGRRGRFRSGLLPPDEPTGANLNPGGGLGLGDGPRPGPPARPRGGKGRGRDVRRSLGLDREARGPGIGGRSGVGISRFQGLGGPGSIGLRTGPDQQVTGDQGEVRREGPGQGHRHRPDRPGEQNGQRDRPADQEVALGPTGQGGRHGREGQMGADRRRAGTLPIDRDGSSMLPEIGRARDRRGVLPGGPDGLKSGRAGRAHGAGRGSPQSRARSAAAPGSCRSSSARWKGKKSLVPKRASDDSAKYSLGFEAA